MYSASNDENSILQRRYASGLVMCGRAVIILSIWSIVRTMVLYLLNGELAADLAEQGLSRTDKGYYTMVIVILIVVAVVLFLSVIFNIYIGRSAIREGRGKKKSVMYLVITTIAALAVFWSDVIVNRFDFSNGAFLELSTIIIDATMLFAYVMIIYFSVRLRKCRG